MNIGGKTVELFRAESANAPLVILNEYQHSSGEIYRKCRELGCRDFTLAEIAGLDWNSELSPWKLASFTAEEPPFGGKADEYLDLLTTEILPAIRNHLDGEPQAMLIAGYSLAGLFALYASVKCQLFRAAASCSGSLWFPGFAEYIKEQKITQLPPAIYLSLGDREAHTKNRLLLTVEEHTKELADYFSENGICTVFERNKGNHFQQGELRTAKGIKWILGQTTGSES